MQNPLGVKYLWPVFGIANQVLAAVALCVATTIIIGMGKAKYAWTTALPLAWLVTVTMIAGWQRLFTDDVNLGFLKQIAVVKAKIAEGVLPAGAKTMEEAHQILLNAQLDAVICARCMAVIIAMLVTSGWRCIRMLSGKDGTAVISKPEPGPGEAEMREG